MAEKMTILPSLRNQDWKIAKAESEKKLTIISTNNITEINELIYAGTKSYRDKIDIPVKNTNRNLKTRWEIRLEKDIRNLWQQAKMITKRENAGIWLDEKRKPTQPSKPSIKLEDIYQKMLANEGRLRIYIYKIKQYTQNRTFQSNERKFNRQVGW